MSCYNSRSIRLMTECKHCSVYFFWGQQGPGDQRSGSGKALKACTVMPEQAEGRSRGDVTQKSLISGPYTLIHLLIVALIAFFLGHYL
jgi:hypothetical protein